MNIGFYLSISLQFMRGALVGNYIPSLDCKFQLLYN